MKKLLAAVFSIMLTVAPAQKSEAAVAAVMAMTGAGAAGSVAIAGLASPFVGSIGYGIAGSGDDMSQGIGIIVGAYIGILVGAVLLDEESGDIQFNEIDSSVAEQLNISKSDIATYNSEVEEANIVFEEVRANLSGESSVEESRAVWSEMKEFVSPATFKVMQKLASQE